MRVLLEFIRSLTLWRENYSIGSVIKDQECFSVCDFKLERLTCFFELLLFVNLIGRKEPLVCLQITKVPVQTCHLKTDCQSCMSLKDPYCGWCVLEGK